MLYAFVIALLAFRAKLLTWNGALAATLVGGLVWEAAEWSTAIPLLMFFFSASLLSQIGKARKNAIGLEMKPRNAIQVLANGGASFLCAMLFLWTKEPSFLVALIGGIAAATADTWATEVGAAFGTKAFRITTLERANPGKSGAVSTVGLIASFCGAAFIASALPLIGRTDLIPLIATFGFLGSILDSILGDCFQKGGNSSLVPAPSHTRGRGFFQYIKKPRWMTNDMVNFLSVSVITVCCYFVARY